MSRRHGALLVLIVLLGVGGTGLLASCSGKLTERFKDAPVQSRNDGPAHIGTMPDGFGNWAAKCDGTNMVYTLFHQDSAYGGIAVVPNDPRCR